MKFKTIFAVMATFASLMLLSCNSNMAAEEQDETNVASDSARWRSITPYDIKNAVELFNKDWMALAVGTRGDMNAMTISWGSLGELWGRPVVIVYVSSSRYTYEFMERNQYFTVTAFPESKREALQYIGTHSGRDGDKLSEAGLTPEFTELGNPVFREATLAIECKIIYSAPFDIEKIDPDAAKIYERGMGVHTMYIGEILNAWER
ncbi:MAG: flavin reductase family protein [Duncaniella sp.]|nr:flavin reductase family protein [Duncaniella sp.]